MTPDLNNLVGSAALCLVQAVIAVLGSLQQSGGTKARRIAATRPNRWLVCALSLRPLTSGASRAT